MSELYATKTPYNYWLNINHPSVNAAYKEFCRKTGHPERYPLSDAQRRTFEVMYLMRNGVDWRTPEWVRFQFAEFVEKYACRL